MWVWTQVEVVWWKQESEEGYIARGGKKEKCSKGGYEIHELGLGVWSGMVWMWSCDPIVYCELGL